MCSKKSSYINYINFITVTSSIENLLQSHVPLPTFGGSRGLNSSGLSGQSNTSRGAARARQVSGSSRCGLTICTGSPQGKTAQVGIIHGWKIEISRNPGWTISWTLSWNQLESKNRFTKFMLTLSYSFIRKPKQIPRESPSVSRHHRSDLQLRPSAPGRRNDVDVAAGARKAALEAWCMISQDSKINAVPLVHGSML